MAAERVKLLVCEIPDEPGGLMGALQAVADARIDLLCVLAHRTFGGKAQACALAKPGQDIGSMPTIDAVLVSGPDAVGSAAAALKPLADAGVNLSSAVAVGKDGEMHLLLIADDVDAALAALS